MSILPEKFYLQKTVTVAQKLLGKIIVRKTLRGILSAMIVETEAYLQEDPASHSYKGITERSQAMFLPGGISYVYFIYGKYNCFNIVTEKSGYGAAVLIRAVQPLSGLEQMWQNRFGKKNFAENKITNLANGPGKLCQALQITKEKDNCKSLINSDLIIREGIKPKQIVSSPRIGISKALDKNWRFYIKDNLFVSQI